MVVGENGGVRKGRGDGKRCHARELAKGGERFGSSMKVGYGPCSIWMWMTGGSGGREINNSSSAQRGSRRIGRGGVWEDGTTVDLIFFKSKVDPHGLWIRGKMGTSLSVRKPAAQFYSPKVIRFTMTLLKRPASGSRIAANNKLLGWAKSPAFLEGAYTKSRACLKHAKVRQSNHRTRPNNYFLFRNNFFLKHFFYIARTIKKLFQNKINLF